MVRREVNRAERISRPASTDRPVEILAIETPEASCAGNKDRNLKYSPHLKNKENRRGGKHEDMDEIF